MRNRLVAFEADGERYRFMVRNETGWEPVTARRPAARARIQEFDPLQLILEPVGTGNPDSCASPSAASRSTSPFVLTMANGDNTRRHPRRRRRPLHGRMTSPRPCARFPPAAGFTLLEVLVALVIVGTALGAVLRAVGSLTSNSDGLRASMMATWSAENRLVQIRLEREFPEVGKRSFACPQGDLNLMCEEEVLTSPNPLLRRVEVSVFDVDKPGRRIVKLVQLVLRPSPV